MRTDVRVGAGGQEIENVARRARDVGGAVGRGTFPRAATHSSSVVAFDSAVSACSPPLSLSSQASREMLQSHTPDYTTPYTDTVPDDRSAYSMATVHDPPSSPTARTSLLSSNGSDAGYGVATPSTPSNRRLLWNATLKMGAIFFISTVLLGGTLWLALPTLEECVPVPPPTKSILIALHLRITGRTDRRSRSQRASRNSTLSMYY